MKNAVLDRIGREILILKNKFKVREGFKPSELRISSRIFETPAREETSTRKRSRTP